MKKANPFRQKAHPDSPARRKPDHTGARTSPLRCRLGAVPQQEDVAELVRNISGSEAIVRRVSLASPSGDSRPKLIHPQIRALCFSDESSTMRAVQRAGSPYACTVPNNWDPFG